MAWIRIPEGDGAPPGVEALLAPHVDPRRGEVDEILRVHSLDPGGLEAHLALYTSAMGGTPGLPRVDRELVALVVSRLNGCHY